MKVMLNVNGKVADVEVDDPNMPLLYALRNSLALRGPRFGCGLAQCGACSVLIDGKETRSCVTLATDGRATTGDALAAAAGLRAQGVRVDVCLNTVDTIERDTGKRPEFIPAATPVQVGVGQILLLTENGYTLVRP